MDAYLDLALQILRAARRPLSPRAILVTAYNKHIVPSHLYGRTQHKTLQARISEDIIARRDQSPFFRTAPGQFFLREFLKDSSLPDEFRSQFPARRRIRELVRGPSLAIKHELLLNIASENEVIPPSKIFKLLEERQFFYEDPRANSNDLTFVRSFVCVVRNQQILTYRLGRYREDRDNFISRRTIGFSTFISRDEHTLFNRDNLGIVEAGLRATAIDLDIPREFEQTNSVAKLKYFVCISAPNRKPDLLAVITFVCPTWFEPSRRRLALNDLAWLNIENPINNFDDFDPWSRSLLFKHYRMSGCYNDAQASHSSADDQNDCRLSEITD